MYPITKQAVSAIFTGKIGELSGVLPMKMKKFTTIFDGKSKFNKNYYILINSIFYSGI